MSGEVERVKAILEAAPGTVNARGPKNVRAMRASVVLLKNAAVRGLQTRCCIVAPLLFGFGRKESEGGGGRTEEKCGVVINVIQPEESSRRLLVSLFLDGDTSAGIESSTAGEEKEERTRYHSSRPIQTKPTLTKSGRAACWLVGVTSSPAEDYIEESRPHAVRNQA